MRNKAVTVSTLMGIAALAATAVVAGPLTPPAGPVTPTYKTLTEIEPRTAINQDNTPGNFNSTYRITAPGSYYLTENLIGQDNEHGIDIAASNVTIDLNGFTLISPAAALTLNGISSAVSLIDLTVTNGSVIDWDGTGIELSRGNTIRGVRIIDVSVSGSASDGIRAGTNAIIRGCNATDNGLDGIVAGDGAVITNCVTENNAGDGIMVADNASVTDCVSTNNGNRGFNVTDGATLTGCSAISNAFAGFLIGAGATVTDCTARNSGGSGFIIFRGVTMSNSAAEFNSQNGIVAGESANVFNCSSNFNTNDGIVVSFHSTIRNNNCNANGVGVGIGAGIRVSDSNNRIDGNNVINNDRGIQVTGAGNLIVRNSARGSGVADYAIVAGNSAGTISVSPVGAGAWDNLAY